MIEDKICIRAIGTNHEYETLIRPLRGVATVEQLVHNILVDKGVGPVHKSLFGLKVSDCNIWLAPNVKIRDLRSLVDGYTKEPPKLELRMRFRPACVSRLNVQDKPALHIIFAQLRHDFMITKFNNEKRDFVLLDDAVLGLIAADLLRYSIENSISVTEILKRVNPKDFVPKRAARWQRALLFRMAERLKLQKTLEVGFEKCENDLDGIKQRFCEVFLTEVAPDYALEAYNVYRNESRLRPMELRVRFQQKEDETYCYVEERLRTSPNNKNLNSWTEICDIETISHATIRDNVAQIARLNGCPVRLEFETNLHAQSFISCVDGYYRLMRKWNLNLCKEVSSPELIQLKRLRCHGPVGFEFSRTKLAQVNKSGAFLVRKCMKNHNRYLIDTVLLSGARLSIEVDWDNDSRNFKKVGHLTARRAMKTFVSTELEEYSDLKNLISDIQIRVQEYNNSTSLQHLKHWLPPGEYDDCPAILLSMSIRKLREFELNEEAEAQKSFNELPRVIPPEMIRISNDLLPWADNQVVTKQGILKQEPELDVVIRDASYDDDLFQGNICASFHHCSGDHKKRLLASGASYLRPDWAFTKHHLFAETIGFIIVGGALVQEHFKLGSLDKFLTATRVSSIVKLSISFQLSQALIFMQERNIIHGKIRCHNIFVKQAHPIRIKLGDPFGSFDIERDRAFISPEYFGMRGQLCIKKFDTGIDVWAFGTTLWQIYNNGKRPGPRIFATTLMQPAECLDEIWQLIETCWILDPNHRAAPQVLFRDLNQLFAWEKDSHEYLYICSEGPEDPNYTDLESVSDQSILNSISCASTISPISNGSQSNLLKVINNTEATNRKQIQSAKPSHSNIPNKRTCKAALKSIMQFKGTPILCGRSSSIQRQPMNSENASEISDSSSLSFSSYHSEATKMTDLPDMGDDIHKSLDRLIWHVDSSRLKIGPEIGRGSNGVVLKGVMSQVDGSNEQPVAVKYIDRDCSDYSPSKMDDLRREFDILKDLKHPNIVKTLGYVDETYMMLIFEFMPGGSLLSYIKNNRHDYLHSMPLHKYALDIARGMEYLEQQKIVHRDLALRNILVKDNDEVKICDFGLAQFLGHNNHYKLKTDRALPLKWYAPETLTTWTFTHKSDVWSYGVVLWEIYSGGDSPQYNGTYADLSETLRYERLTMPKDCPTKMYNLMNRCWAYKPETRDSFTKLRIVLEGYYTQPMSKMTTTTTNLSPI